MNELKVKILTFHAVCNHESALQTLATLKKFESMGCEVEFIDYRRKDCVSAWNLVKFWNKDVRFAMTLLR